MKSATTQSLQRSSRNNWWRRLLGCRATLEGGDSQVGVPDLSWCIDTREQARQALKRGDADGAEEHLQTLVARLDPHADRINAELAPQLAAAYRQLATLLRETRRRPDLALRFAGKAVAALDDLHGGETQQERALALVSLARTHYDLGQLDTAEQVARQALKLTREQGYDPGTAEALLAIATSLTRQQRYEEADAHFREAMVAARAIDDAALQGNVLQRRGILQRRRGQHSHAIDLLLEAIRKFQQVENRHEEMRTCDMLANAKVQFGELQSAATWYERSRELAADLADRNHLAIIAHNMGILYQKQAEAADDPEIEHTLLQQAMESLNDSLAIKIELNKEVGAEASYFQLGVLHWKLGALGKAEENLLRATRISEALNLPKVYQNYSVLGRIYRDMGNTEAALDWDAKCASKVLELKRRKQKSA